MQHNNLDRNSLWKDVIEDFFEDFVKFFSKELHEIIDFMKKKWDSHGINQT